ncbi:DUF1410 domain-containing protein [Ureaplasma urealyticum]|uniref:DUF1410 domain-containing protein n=1 Tax=Ureaplasma urealyticum TaxID=2130 RepID=UPI00031E42CA|nr:DUF1410 domain-containing protein [Ureaplasma urealyticum]
MDFENEPAPTPTPQSTPTPKEDKAVVSKVELVDSNKENKQAKVKLEFSELSLKDETKKVLKLTLTSGNENKEVELELSADKLSATSKELVDFSTKTYKVSKLTLNETNVELTDTIKNQELKVEASPSPQPNPPAPAPKKDEAIVSGVKINKDKNNIATIEITFSKLVLADDSKKSFILEVKDSTKTIASPIVATELVLYKNKKTLVGKLNNLKTNVDYKISKLTLNNQNVEFDENALLKSYVDQAKLTMTFDNTNKKVNVKLENFSILNSLEDKQPILVFDIEITKDGTTPQTIHKSLTKSQLLNPNGLEINLKDKIKDTNGVYTVKLTNAKLLNINIETKQ